VSYIRTAQHPLEGITPPRSQAQSTRTAASIAATVATERKTPWVMAARYTFPGPEGLAGSIYPSAWKGRSANFACIGFSEFRQ
jgi:hypothetical protein